MRRINKICFHEREHQSAVPSKSLERNKMQYSVQNKTVYVNHPKKRKENNSINLMVIVMTTNMVNKGR
jgi:hypothetical protein